MTTANERLDQASEGTPATASASAQGQPTVSAQGRPSTSAEDRLDRISGSAQSPGFLRFEALIAWRIILVVAAGLLVVWLGMQVTVIAVAAFIGFAQAALLWPAVQRLEQHIPRAPASIAVVAVYAAGILLLGYFITTQMVHAWPQFYSAVVGAITAANDWFVEQGWVITGDFANNLEQELIGRLGTLASGIGGVAITVMGGLGAFSTIIVVALFATLFALIGGERMVQGIVGAVAQSRQHSAFAAIRDATSTARWWVIASAVTGAVDGIFIGLGMALLGVPLAVPIGLATFILGFIPMVGATVAGALAVAVALFFNGWVTAIWVLVLVLAVQQIEGNILAPLLLSRAMKFPPLVTLLLSTGGGVALGLPGLFLAVPTAGVLVAATKAWRRELPEEVRAARGIGANPKPTFAELRAQVPEPTTTPPATTERAGAGVSGRPSASAPDPTVTERAGAGVSGRPSASAPDPTVTERAGAGDSGRPSASAPDPTVTERAGAGDSGRPSAPAPDPTANEPDQPDHQTEGDTRD